LRNNLCPSTTFDPIPKRNIPQKLKTPEKKYPRF